MHDDEPKILSIWVRPDTGRVTAHVQLTQIREEIRYEWSGSKDESALVCIIPKNKNKRGRRWTGLSDVEQGDLLFYVGEVVLSHSEYRHTCRQRKQ